MPSWNTFRSPPILRRLSILTLTCCRATRLERRCSMVRRLSRWSPTNNRATLKLADCGRGKRRQKSRRKFRAAPVHVRARMRA